MREQILEAASEPFDRQGVTATGLEQIVAASGMGKGQLYHYFGGKRDLTHAVIERQAPSIMADQQPRLDVLATRADLRAWADALMDSYAGGDHRSRVSDRRARGGTRRARPRGPRRPRARLRSLGLRRWPQVLRACTIMASLPPRRPPTACDLAVVRLPGGLLLAQVRGDVAVA